MFTFFLFQFQSAPLVHQKLQSEVFKEEELNLSEGLNAIDIAMNVRGVYSTGTIFQKRDDLVVKL